MKDQDSYLGFKIEQRCGKTSAVFELKSACEEYGFGYNKTGREVDVTWVFRHDTISEKDLVEIIDFNRRYGLEHSMFEAALTELRVCTASATGGPSTPST